MKKQKKHFKKTNTETRILIVDDHQVVREGLKNIINRNQDLRVCAEAKNLNEAKSVMNVARCKRSALRSLAILGQPHLKKLLASQRKEQKQNQTVTKL